MCDEDTDCHYATLGVPPDVAPEALRAAFRARSLADHPDKRPDGAPDAFRRLMRAWEG
jgi:curved DNA-binding protein CbpA